MRQWLGPNPGARWKRLATFDGAVLQEIYRDTTAVVPAMLTVALVMFVSALGGLLWAVLEDVPDKLGFFLDSVVIGALVATGMFFVWAGLVAAMAGQVGRQDSAALTATVRTLSFATVPFTFSFFHLSARPGLCRHPALRGTAAPLHHAGDANRLGHLAGAGARLQPLRLRPLADRAKRAQRPRRPVRPTHLPVGAVRPLTTVAGARERGG